MTCKCLRRKYKKNKQTEGSLTLMFQRFWQAEFAYGDWIFSEFFDFHLKSTKTNVLYV